MRERDFKVANKTITRALEIEGGNVNIVSAAASISLFSGRIDEANELRRLAIGLDPLEYRYYLNLALGHYMKYDLDSAMKSLELFSDHRPDAGIVYAIKAKVLLAQGKTDEAALMAEKEQNAFWKMYAKNLTLFA